MPVEDVDYAAAASLQAVRTVSGTVLEHGGMRCSSLVVAWCRRCTRRLHATSIESTGREVADRAVDTAHSPSSPRDRSNTWGQSAKRDTFENSGGPSLSRIIRLFSQLIREIHLPAMALYAIMTDDVTQLSFTFLGIDLISIIS